MNPTNPNSGQGKGYSVIKGLSFLKTNHHPTQGTEASSSSGNIDGTNHANHTKNPLKLLGKSKASNHDQHHLTSGHQSPQSQPSGVASFNAIFRSQAIGNMHDERIMLEEWLQKRSGSLQMVWKRRWCVLRDDCLYYYRSNTDTKPLGVLHLADFSILASSPDLSKKSKFAFRLSSPESVPNEHRHHLFFAETPQAFELWFEAIQGHINHALTHLESLSPLSIPEHSHQSSKKRYGNHGPTNPFDSTEPEQSIIDKVLDRLQLEDPTLSDINDPSTLIMPAHDHASPSQRPTQKPIGKSRLDLDDDLNGWPSSTRITTTTKSSSTLYNCNSSNGLDRLHYPPQQLSNISMTKSNIDSLTAQKSPIVIRGGVRYGVPNAISGSSSHSSASSPTEPHSNYSSSTEISFSGHSGGSGSKNNNRSSFHTLDLQGRPGLQSRRSYSASSPTPGYSPQYPFRSHGSPFAIETSGLSPSTSTANSPVSPQIPALSSASGYAVPPPRTLFNKFDSNGSSLERKASSASSASISTIDSNSSEVTGTHDTLDGRGDVMAASDDSPNKIESSNHGALAYCKRANSSSDGGAGFSSSNIFFGKKSTMPFNKNYYTETDLHPSKSEEKVPVTISDKKAKNLWSVHGGDKGSDKSPPSSSDKSSNKTKRGMSQSLDVDMFKGLVLISSPTKKSSSSGCISVNNGKGLSKSMISLARGSPDTDSSGYSSQHQHPLPYYSPLVSTTSSSKLIRTRTRSPSVSLLDEASYRPTVSDILATRPPCFSEFPSDHHQKRHHGFYKQLSAPSFSSSIRPRMATAPITTTGNWSSQVQNRKQQPQRCVDSEHQQQHHMQWISSKSIGSDMAANVTRHIVAPDKLTMAINREIEERRQQQELERSERSLEAKKESMSTTESVPNLVNPSNGSSTRQSLQTVDGATVEPIGMVKIIEVRGSFDKKTVMSRSAAQDENGPSPRGRQHSTSDLTSTHPMAEGHDVLRCAIEATAGPTVALALNGVADNPRSVTSPTSPLSSIPPTLPKRSPFRSAAIPYVV